MWSSSRERPERSSPVWSRAGQSRGGRRDTRLVVRRSEHEAGGQLESYKPANAGKVNKGWIDGDSTLFGYSASAVGVIYNTTVVSELNADWVELADAKYKDMTAIPDPKKSGACKDFLAGLVTGLDKGEAIMQSWAANGLTVPGANRAALEAVTTGEKGILIAGVDYNAYSAMAKGEPLKIYYPASGTVVNPRPAMILKTAPNMDNAKAFVDFLFSDEARSSWQTPICCRAAAT